MAELNDPQAQAVAHLTGPLLVFAGAGSGKTRTITYRIANLLRHGIPPYRILAVTFTNKAAREMQSRLEQLAGPELVRDLWVGTFHSVCARLLRRYATEVGLAKNFVIYDESDQKAVVARLTKSLGLSEDQFAPKLVLSRILKKKQEGVLPRDVPLSRGFDEVMLNLYQKYQAALTASNAVDFEDLLLYVMRLAEHTQNPAGTELRQRFDHVLVDEFQDTNAVQYRLVRALSAETRNLGVVGDDDQSIYRWRGADVRIIRNFRRDFPDATIIKLEQNYRSTGNIVRTALSVIETSRTREPKKLWTARDPGDKIVVRSVPDERQEAAWVVRDIKRAVTDGVSAAEIAVFYRVHAQSRVLEEALRTENLPYQVIGGVRFFDRAEVKDILSYLRLLDNPRSDADFLRIVNVPARGIGKKTVDALGDLALARGTSLFDALGLVETAPELGGAARSKLLVFRELLTRLTESKTALSPEELAVEVLTRTGYREQLEQQDTAEADARLGNVNELIGSIAEYVAEAALAGEAATLTGYLERVSLVTSTDTMSDQPKVSLMTVHAAKGLEFDVVLLTGLEDGIFPYVRMGETEPEELDEERRLMYVAVTRAKQRLIISHATQRALFGQTRYQVPSTFLRDLPDACVVGEARSYGSAAPEWSDGWSGTQPKSARTPVSAPPRSFALSHERSSATPASKERTIDHCAFDDLAHEQPSFVIGQKVFHTRFGTGRVQSVERGQDGPTVVAHFSGFGPRKILARFLATTPPRNS